ncbi:hypothetical protein [Methylomonas rosea]|uniref:Lipoprotein n=1 Tax=Methylomonas rosea TaxID=2952227 RepID=A0ABT1TQM0_9GAMM|nr:hypothetical protein [Methylomonas sp. WSC-7]MCQ8116671.1 hypothetical protein [Methylomonas sp. WSC-7]
MRHLKISNQLLCCFFILTIGSACQTVYRENIVSSINTGIGLFLAENPQTELYEIKAGYVRSQYYSIPTGKIVKNEDKNENIPDQTDKRSNQADITPEVVSGIKMSSGVENLFLDMNVSENFAVGKAAVNSPAAVAMYIATAANENTASSAAKAVNSVSPSAMKAVIQKDGDVKFKSKEIIDYLAPDGTLKTERLAPALSGTGIENKIDKINSAETLIDILKKNELDIDDIYKKIATLRSNQKEK